MLTAKHTAINISEVFSLPFRPAYDGARMVATDHLRPAKGQARYRTTGKELAETILVALACSSRISDDLRAFLAAVRSNGTAEMLADAMYGKNRPEELWLDGQGNSRAIYVEYIGEDLKVRMDDFGGDRSGKSFVLTAAKISELARLSS